MLLSSSLLILFLECCSAKKLGKLGDFGLLTSCINKNSSLKLECYYPPCPSGSTEFSCQFKTGEDVLLASSREPRLQRNDSVFFRREGVCTLLLLGHKESHATDATSYNCTLVRRQRKEEKYITINYSIRTGKDHIRPCSTAGLLLHQAPSILWPLIVQLLKRLLS